MSEKRELPGAGLVVVVVDDDTAVRNSLEFSLELEGFTVRSHADGRELLAASHLASCDCLVIDQKLGNMSGLDVIGLLRQRRITTPAILVTSQPSEGLRERARRAGVPIVEKPLLGNSLPEMIRTVVRARDDGSVG